MANFRSKEGAHLPTVLKTFRTSSAVSFEGGESLLNEFVDLYHAVDKNKRVLFKDSKSIPGRHLEVFSKRRNVNLETIVDIPVGDHSYPEKHVAMPGARMPNTERQTIFKESKSIPVRQEVFGKRRNLETIVDIPIGDHSYDPEKHVEMPGARMPNTERQPTPPPSYENANRGRQPGRNQRRGQPPPQPPVYQVYYVPGEQPVNTRDFPSHRRNDRGPAHQLVDRQLSSDYLFDKQLRKNFVFRVYIMLSVLLSFTFGCCIVTNLVPPIAHFFIEFWWISIIFMILYLGFSIALMCFTSVRRSFPLNLILLCCMCFCITIMLCTVVANYSTQAVLLAIGTTLLITVTISFLAKVCPCDVTGCGMLMLILLLVFSLYTLISFIVSIFIYEPILNLVYGGIGTVLFSFFLFFDTQQILGGRRVELNPEEYILGTVLLYIDIIMIFLMLLNVYGYAD